MEQKETWKMVKKVKMVMKKKKGGIEAMICLWFMRMWGTKAKVLGGAVG